MKLTAIGSGYFRVYANGLEVSKHTSEREAVEAAVNLEAVNPSSEITYKHDYEVKVEVEAPAPVPPPAPTPPPPPGPSQIFALSSFWNVGIQANPKHLDSSALVNEIVLNTKAPGGVWINTVEYTVPFNIVPVGTPKRVVTQRWKDGKSATTEPGLTIQKQFNEGFRVPAKLITCLGADGSCLIWDQEEDSMAEFWQLREEGGQLYASWGAVLKNVSGHNGIVTPAGIGSRATGLALAGGIIRVQELQAGKIPHALAITIQYPSNKFVWPANRSDGYAGHESWMGSAQNWPITIPEGQRFRFPQSIVIDPSWSPFIKMVVEAVRDYGLIIADRGGATAFCCEDPAQFITYATEQERRQKGEAIYRAFYGTKPDGTLKQPWDILPQFPWSLLEAVS